MRSRTIVVMLAFTFTAGAAQAQPTDPPPKPSAPAVSVAYDKGLTFANEDETFQLKTLLRGQLRTESRRADIGGANLEQKTNFQIPRLRIQFEGIAYGPNNAFKIEFDMAGRGFAILKDAFFDNSFSDKLKLRIGEWKKPINRQEMMSEFSRQFLEASLTTDFAGAGRDLGIALHNGYDKSPEGIEWAIGLFNGTGDRALKNPVLCTDPADPTTCVAPTPTNVPADFQPDLVARIGYNQGGIKGYSEADLEGGPLRFAVGASYQLRFNDRPGDIGGFGRHSAVVDALVKVNGLSALVAGYLVKVGEDDPHFGALVQPGYFLVPKTYEVSARFAFRPTDADPDETIQEILGAFTWYWEGHNLKWGTDFGVIRTSGVDTTDLQIRSQLQFQI
jgi:hypothetical protein